MGFNCINYVPGYCLFVYFPDDGIAGNLSKLVLKP